MSRVSAMFVFLSLDVILRHLQAEKHNRHTVIVFLHDSIGTTSKLASKTFSLKKKHALEFTRDEIDFFYKLTSYFHLSTKLVSCLYSNI
jgi:hypothetical protein